MSVSNNPWSSWSTDIQEGYIYTEQMSKEASSDAAQLEALAAEEQAGTLDPATYQADVIKLNNQVSADETSIANAASGIISNSLCSAEMSAFNTAWGSAISSCGLGITNPVSNPNGPTPLLQETVNADGSVSFSFVVSYYHNSWYSEYPIGLNCGCCDDNPNLGWMPDDGDNSFGDYLGEADSNGSAQFSWSPNGQTVNMNIQKNGDGTFTITVTMSAAAMASFSSINPNFTSLNSFVSAYSA